MKVRNCAINVRNCGRGLDQATVYGKHPGETIIIVGNSASLNEMDIKKFDQYTTIGLNRILRLYEPDYLMIVDQSCMRDEMERVNAFYGHGTVLLYPGVMNSSLRAKYKGEFVSTGDMNGAADPTSKKGPIHICRGGNTAYEATQIAYRMGATRILLAGIDMYWPPGKASHFFGDGMKAGCKMMVPEWKIEDFAALKKLYASVGIEVTSLSPWKTKFRERMGFTNW